MEVIGSVVSMAVGFENRSEVESVGAEALDMVQPAQDLAQARLGSGLKIIKMGRAASPQGVNVIENAVLIDSGHKSSEIYQAV
jgi:hypothetical protein